MTSPESGTSRNLIAVAQMTATSNKAENLSTCQKLIQEASHHGAKMIFLPEAFDFIADSQAQSLELSETLDGPGIKSLSNIAVENKIWLSLGGFHNKMDTGKMCNTHLVIDDQGKIAGQYDKTHLFDIEIPEKKLRLKESDYIQRGSSISPPVQSPIGKIGLGICYDLRFPELNLSLVRMGAEVLTYPSAFTTTTGMSHWEPLLRARAIESQCYVVAAAQTGNHNAKRSSYGHAMVVDPWGAVVAQCQEGTGIALATIDLEYVKKIRREMPVASHRRPDIYELPIPNTRRSLPLPADDEIFPFGQVKVFGWGIFYRSRHTVAFVNRKCVVPGHVLLMPTRLALRLGDLSTDEVSDLFLTAQKVQHGMELFHKVTSSTVNLQDGPDAGQSIQHVHVHVLPRKPKDFPEYDDIYDKLRKHDKGPDIVWRPEEDMKKEANELRQFFASLYS